MLKQKGSRELAIKMFLAGAVAVGLAACGGDDNNNQPVMPSPAYQQTNPYAGYDQSNPGSIPPGGFAPGFQPAYQPWAIPRPYISNDAFFFTVSSGNSWCRYRGTPGGVVTVYTTGPGWMGGPSPFIRGGAIYAYAGASITF